MACPFSSERFNESYDDGDGDESGDAQRIGGIGHNDAAKSRQSSIEVSTLLTREEIEDAEDTQTLNLKHLRAAVLVLTNPKVSNPRSIVFLRFSAIEPSRLGIRKQVYLRNSAEI